jgi:hypothetical protein
MSRRKILALHGMWFDVYAFFSVLGLSLGCGSCLLANVITIVIVVDMPTSNKCGPLGDLAGATALTLNSISMLLLLFTSWIHRPTNATTPTSGSSPQKLVLHAPALTHMLHRTKHVLAAPAVSRFNPCSNHQTPREAIM